MTKTKETHVSKKSKLPLNERKLKRINWWKEKQKQSDVVDVKKNPKPVQKVIKKPNKHGFKHRSLEKEESAGSSSEDDVTEKLQEKRNISGNKDSVTHKSAEISEETEKKEKKSRKKKKKKFNDDGNISENKDSVTHESAENSEETKKKEKKSRPKKKYYVLFIGNFTFDTTEQDIHKHFESSGNIQSIRLLTDKKTGKPRGCGFLQLKDNESYSNAVKLHHSWLKNRQINVACSAVGKNSDHKKKYILKKNEQLYKEQNIIF